jgi:type VI secretion system protein ImpG
VNDELLQYYNRELAFIRKMGAEFAEAHPKIAGRLRLSADTVEDPHVSRMIEAFALLTARTRHKIDDDFPEVTEALLSILQPHYLRPIPSMAVTQFEFGNEHASLLAGYTIERGTEVLTEPIDGEPCRFRTAYATKVWPIRVTDAKLQGPPFTVPFPQRGRAAGLAGMPRSRCDVRQGPAGTVAVLPAGAAAVRLRPV